MPTVGVTGFTFVYTGFTRRTSLPRPRRAEEDAGGADRGDCGRLNQTIGDQMSVTKKSAGKVGTQSVRQFQVAPVARAVRIALAATTLALAGSGAAYAGTCATSASTTQCTGSFTDTLSFPDAVDLTL